MAITIPDLWPDDLDVDVLTPQAILLKQAELLARRTKGIVSVRVHTTGDEKQVKLLFEIWGDAIGYRELVLEVSYPRDRVYPATLKSPILPYEDEEMEHTAMAYTQEDFLALTGKVFASNDIRSLIQSIIARTNEQRSWATPATDDDPAK
jgi:hypothetical protein